MNKNWNHINHVFLENGQCDLDLCVVPLLLTVEDDDVEFERRLWEPEPVDEHELRLEVDTCPELENMSMTQGLRLFLSNDSKNTNHIFIKNSKNYYY